jgi:hypothetical protein
MDNQKTQFAPFHAINDFMLPEFRLHVLQTVLSRLDQLTPERRTAIQKQIKRSLKIPGFRNALLAPLPVKIKNSVSIFERSPEYAAQIIAGWADLHPELRAQVFELLTERGWELLPADVERTKLPGYLTRWPGSDSFEVIVKAFQEKFSQTDVTDHDISLMAVWLSTRLPYDVVEKPEESDAS